MPSTGPEEITGDAIRTRRFAVPIADAMRHGGLDRIEREAATDFKDSDAYARNRIRSGLLAALSDSVMAVNSGMMAKARLARGSST